MNHRNVRNQINEVVVEDEKILSLLKIFSSEVSSLDKILSDDLM
jgi:hypothetical protein